MTPTPSSGRCRRPRAHRAGGLPQLASARARRLPHHRATHGTLSIRANRPFSRPVTHERVGAVTAPGPRTGSPRLHADLTILAKLSCPLSRARPVLLAAKLLRSYTGPAPQSIPFASRVRCLVALGACRRRTALGPGLLAAGPASNPTLLSIGSARASFATRFASLRRAWTSKTASGRGRVVGMSTISPIVPDRDVRAASNFRGDGFGFGRHALTTPARAPRTHVATTPPCPRSRAKPATAACGSRSAPGHLHVVIVDADAHRANAADAQIVRRCATPTTSRATTRPSATPCTSGSAAPAAQGLSRNRRPYVAVWSEPDAAQQAA